MEKIPKFGNKVLRKVLFCVGSLAVRASRGRNGAVVIMQRGCRRHATGPPRRPREALTARSKIRTENLKSSILLIYNVLRKTLKNRKFWPAGVCFQKIARFLELIVRCFIKMLMVC